MTPPPFLTQAERIAADRQRLAELFPSAIAAPGSPGPRRPLMIGALEAILARAPTTADGTPLTKTRIRRALRDYCAGPRYLRGVLDSPHRVDLEGHPAGEVTPEQRETARNALERLARIGRYVYVVTHPARERAAAEAARARAVAEAVAKAARAQAVAVPPFTPPPAPSRGGAVTFVRGGSGTHRPPPVRVEVRPSRPSAPPGGRRPGSRLRLT